MIRRVGLLLFVYVAGFDGIRQTVRIGKEKLCMFRRKFPVNVIVIQLIHDSLCNIQDDHSSKYRFVHHNLSFSEVRHCQILVDDVKTVTRRLSNVTFGIVRIRNQLDVHAITKLLDRFPINRIAEQLV